MNNYRMEPEIIEITGLKIESGDELKIRLEVFESDIVSVRCRFYDVTHQGEGEGYFEAFQRLRDSLLTAGIGLKCYGAMINAHASVMMENVPQVYLLRMKYKPTRQDVVDMFGYADVTHFPTTQEQVEFSQEWFDSL